MVANTKKARAVFSSDQLQATSESFIEARQKCESAFKPENVSENRAKALKMTAGAARIYIVAVVAGYDSSGSNMRQLIQTAFPGITFDKKGMKNVLARQRNDVLTDDILLSSIVEWIYNNDDDEARKSNNEEKVQVGVRVEHSTF